MQIICTILFHSQCCRVFHNPLLLAPVLAFIRFFHIIIRIILILDRYSDPLLLERIPPEIIALFGSYCDAASKMMLYLTCKQLYFTPNRPIGLSRPRMSWGAFAASVMESGHEGLLLYGLHTIGIPSTFFSRHRDLAARFHHKHLFKIDEIESLSPSLVTSHRPLLINQINRMPSAWHVGEAPRVTLPPTIGFETTSPCHQKLNGMR